jgi:superfamily II DNA or RNA helicase
MVTLTIKEKTTLSPLAGLPWKPLQALRNHFIFANPEHQDRKKRGLWLGEIPEELSFMAEYGDRAIFPRGATRQVADILKSFGVPYQVDDHRRMLPKMNFTFAGTLRPYQAEAVASILIRDFGTLAAPAGSGKTCMALAAIAERQQPALVVVHTKELMGQWVERIAAFLGISKAEIGRIGGGKQAIGDRITVALVQTLYKCAKDVAPHIGFLVVDECHRAPSRTFTEAVTAFDCRYMLGLSATPYRRDGLSRLIYWHLGDVVHQVDAAELQETGDILRAAVITRETDFVPTVDPSTHYSRMLSELTQNLHRNSMIAKDILREAQVGDGVVLVLSDRKTHLAELQRMLKRDGVNGHMLTGDMPAKARAQAVTQVNDGRVKVLLATGSLIGEGFDCRRLSTLILATPIRFSGRVRQYLGRVLRPAPGKRAKVIDYIDSQCGVLANAARARQQVYSGAS